MVSHGFPVDFLIFSRFGPLPNIAVHRPAGDPTNIGDAWARMPRRYLGLPNENPKLRRIFSQQNYIQAKTPRKERDVANQMWFHPPSSMAHNTTDGLVTSHSLGSKSYMESWRLPKDLRIVVTS